MIIRAKCNSECKTWMRHLWPSATCPLSAGAHVHIYDEMEQRCKLLIVQFYLKAAVFPRFPPTQRQLFVGSFFFRVFQSQRVWRSVCSVWKSLRRPSTSSRWSWLWWSPLLLMSTSCRSPTGYDNVYKYIYRPMCLYWESCTPLYQYRHRPQ